VAAWGGQEEWPKAKVWVVEVFRGVDPGTVRRQEKKAREGGLLKALARKENWCVVGKRTLGQDRKTLEKRILVNGNTVKGRRNKFFRAKKKKEKG